MIFFSPPFFGIVGGIFLRVSAYMNMIQNTGRLTNWFVFEVSNNKTTSRFFLWFFCTGDIIKDKFVQQNDDVKSSPT